MHNKNAMSSQAETSPITIQWHPQPEAAGYVHEIFDRLCDGCHEIVRFSELLAQKTGTRLPDWIDHYALPASEATESRLEQTGFVPQHQAQSVVWEHPCGLFPQIVAHAEATSRLVIRVESVTDFLTAQGFGKGIEIEGEPLRPLRKARFGGQSGVELWAVERHGFRGWETPEFTSAQVEAVRRHDEAFGRRRRGFDDPEEGFAEARNLVRAAVADLGTGRASDLFFAAERRYWTGRNRAARFQKARQDVLGLGWANHDHHTYRCSRAHFRSLIAVLQELGLVCRERFHAGREAGWGAQVLEQEESQVVVFADVDLSAAEVCDDFAHAPLPRQERFGTVGLWCLLHGESFLEPGMHHRECRFDFDAARKQFEAAGIRVMKAFTDFSYLKQAFTEGEIWPVDGKRREAAVAAGAIDEKQAERFRHAGIVGSHLEILQRDDGYKGFNQTGISEIIRATDPRRLHNGETGAGEMGA